MRKIVRTLFVLAAVGIIPACSDSTGPNRSVTGNYTLISVNGVLLPVVFSAEQFFTLRITAGTLTLNSNNTFTASATYEQTLVIGGARTTDTVNCTGTYAMNGNSITFTEANSTNANCGGVYTGTWDGENALTVDLEVGVQALLEK
jgi:hypothetical protein